MMMQRVAPIVCLALLASVSSAFLVRSKPTTVSIAAAKHDANEAKEELFISSRDSAEVVERKMKAKFPQAEMIAPLNGEGLLALGQTSFRNLRALVAGVDAAAVSAWLSEGTDPRRNLQSFDPQETIDGCPKSKWRDYGRTAFFGRRAFAKNIASNIVKIVKYHETTPPKYRDRGEALVYASISGVGKTRSMLELQNLLPPALRAESLTYQGKVIDDSRVLSSYLGFNSGLSLRKEETGPAGQELSESDAEDILARRLWAASLVAHKAKQIKKPIALIKYSELYMNRKLPPSNTCIENLIEQLSVSPENPLLVVAGVDEVQLLDSWSTKGKSSDNTYLGRFFLRTLRDWQYEYFERGLLIIPLGTGITMQFPYDTTKGSNKPLRDSSDVTIISKDDFRSLAESLKPEGATKAEVAVAAARFYPRTQLLVEWSDEEEEEEEEEDEDLPAMDPQLKTACKEWILRYLADDSFKVEETQYMPGGGNNSPQMPFTISSRKTFKVIPDAYHAAAIAEQLSDDHKGSDLSTLYAELATGCDRLTYRKDQNKWFHFETFGFNVVGAAIQLGMETHKRYDTKLSEETNKLCLAQWLSSRVDTSRRNFLNPKVIWSGDEEEAFFPYKDTGQTILVGKVDALLAEALADGQSMFVETGSRTACDGIFLFPHKNKNEVVAILVDFKHTKKSSKSPERTNRDDELQLFRAAVDLRRVLKKTRWTLVDVLMCITTNRLPRLGAVDPKPKKPKKPSKESEEPKESEEIIAFKEEFGTEDDPTCKFLTRDTFELAPFTDFLFLRIEKD